MTIPSAGRWRKRPSATLTQGEALRASERRDNLVTPAALSKEKVTVAITAALSGAVPLSAINSQLGNVGYLITIAYGFYVYFVLCLLCIVAVLLAERPRAAGRSQMAVRVEQSGRYLYLTGIIGTAIMGWVAYLRW